MKTPKLSDKQAVKILADNSRSIGALAAEILALKATVKAQGEFVADLSQRIEQARKEAVCTHCWEYRPAGELDQCVNCGAHKYRQTFTVTPDATETVNR